MASIIPDFSDWIKALQLPAKIIAGVFLFFVLLLVCDYFAVISLADFGNLARPLTIIGLLLSGSLSIAALGSVISEILAQRRTEQAQRRAEQVAEARLERRRNEATARILRRLDHLSKEEIRYVADCLRKNERSFLTYVHSPPVSNLMAAGLVSTPGGQHHQDYYPFYFADFVWDALLQRRDEFIQKDDEHKRKEVEEKARSLRRGIGPT